MLLGPTMITFHYWGPSARTLGPMFGTWVGDHRRSHRLIGVLAVSRFVLVASLVGRTFNRRRVRSSEGPFLLVPTGAELLLTLTFPSSLNDLNGASWQILGVVPIGRGQNFLPKLVGTKQEPSLTRLRSLTGS